MIDEISPAKLAKNLAWDEIRIISHVDHDYFATWAWDGRVFLMNSGGSHHFAAASTSRRGEQPVELTGTYKIYGLCEQAITELRREYGMFVLSHEPDAWLGFNEAMARFKATYYWKTLPRPHNHQRCAIFTAKGEALCHGCEDSQGKQFPGPRRLLGWPSLSHKRSSTKSIRHN